jgi:eukaryotic-like serine/threonine-protein kinase
MVGGLQAGDPRSVGPYRILGRLGSGGMGQVFLGGSAGGRLVAVKVIRPELAGEPGFRARFGREVAAARNVSGLFTAPVVDADVQGPVAWLATAYVAGPSLAEAVEGQGPLPVTSVLALAAGLAEGLAAVHAAGVVHRDLKPSNVLLSSDGPRVIDFGISRAVEASVLTQSGTVMGSPGFMSPEQAQGGTVGPPSDVFSLGAVLTFAATGTGPFGTGSTPALMYRVVHQEPDISQLPGQLRPLAERCLAKDPGSRPTAAGLLAELGAGPLAADWLPGPVAAALGRYAPDGLAAPAGPVGPVIPGSVPAAGSPLPAEAAAGTPTVTSPGAARTPTQAAGPAPPGGAPGRQRLRHRRRWALAAGAVLAAASAVAAVTLSSAGGPQRSPAGPASSGPASSGPATAAVPSVVGMTRAAATAVLAARGFHNIPYRYGCYRSPDTLDVARQAPGTGARLTPTSPVRLYLQAKNCHTVPRVTGMDLSSAAYTLKQAGFHNIPYRYGCHGSTHIGAVTHQSPAAGTSYGSTQPVSLKLQANNC